MPLGPGQESEHSSSGQKGSQEVTHPCHIENTEKSRSKHLL
jgi:hypothetical protein